MAEKEYIERGAAHKRLMNNKKWTLHQSIMEYAAELVLTVPAADVVEVVHAHWSDHKNGNATCSHCRIRQTAVYDDENEQNFCGHCGAKMDGGKDDGNL